GASEFFCCTQLIRDLRNETDCSRAGPRAHGGGRNLDGQVGPGSAPNLGRYLTGHPVTTQTLFVHGLETCAFLRREQGPGRRLEQLRGWASYEFREGFVHIEDVSF